MTVGFFIIVLVVVGGLVLGRSAREQPAASKRAPLTIIWALIALLIAGLAVAAFVKSETWSWIFGISLMLATPVALFFSMAYVIASGQSGRNKK